MKKIILFIMLLIPLNVFAYSGSLEPDSFYINNQTSQPFNISISGNSSTNVSFHLVWDWYHGSSSNLDLPGSYMFFSIVSDKQIDIDRVASFGSNCTNSCFSNDDYLQLIDDNNGYSYVYYFNIVKWQRNIGTQVDLFNVDDVFKIINKESGNANVYIYGAYADTTNQIPQYINNVNTLQEIIIDNERQTQELIDNSKIYTLIDNSYIRVTNAFLRSNGSEGSNNTWGITGYINITSDDNIIVIDNNSDLTGGAHLCFYDKDKSIISCINNNTLTLNSEVNIPNNTYFVRFSIKKSENLPKLKLIRNGNQVINDNQTEINNSINDINNNITDDNIDNPNSDFSDMEDLIAHNGVITNLIALPITLYSSILNGLNQNCSEYNFGNLFGTDIKFQCINLGNLLGNTIWGVIDVLFSGFTIYAIAKKMIKVFNNFSGLQEGDVIDD